MAFERPLEADRVDDLNLFSVFVRAPVVGTLMWIIGGDKAKEAEELAAKQQIQQELNGNVHCSSRGNTKKSLPSALKKATPSMVGSEISDVGECSEALDGMHLIESNHPLKRQQKQLSWSDESGQSLIEIMGESHHDAALPPVRSSDTGSRLSQGPSSSSSSMPRSRSIRADANRLGRLNDDNRQTTEPRYLPRGLKEAHNGIHVPRGGPYMLPSDHAPGNTMGGVESPQWGWFLRTTPPTPPMYAAATSRSQHTRYGSSGDTSVSSSSSLPPSHQPNPVFQSLQEKKTTGAMGWSGMPL